MYLRHTSHTWLLDQTFHLSITPHRFHYSLHYQFRLYIAPFAELTALRSPSSYSDLAALLQPVVERLSFASPRDAWNPILSITLKVISASSSTLRLPILELHTLHSSVHIVLFDSFILPPFPLLPVVIYPLFPSLVPSPAFRTSLTEHTYSNSSHIRAPPLTELTPPALCYNLQLVSHDSHLCLNSPIEFSVNMHRQLDKYWDGLSPLLHASLIRSLLCCAAMHCIPIITALNHYHT